MFFLILITQIYSSNYGICFVFADDFTDLDKYTITYQIGDDVSKTGTVEANTLISDTSPFTLQLKVSVEGVEGCPHEFRKYDMLKATEYTDESAITANCLPVSKQMADMFCPEASDSFSINVDFSQTDEKYTFKYKIEYKDGTSTDFEVFDRIENNNILRITKSQYFTGFLYVEAEGCPMKFVEYEEAQPYFPDVIIKNDKLPLICESCQITNCIRCRDGDSATDTCMECNTGFTVANGACSSGECDPNCDENSCSAGKCSQCKAGYGYDSTAGSCTKCTGNTVSGGTKPCEVCEASKVPNADNSECVSQVSKCTQNCASGSCDEATGKCSKCEANYGFNSEGLGTCTKCLDGEVSDGNGPCRKTSCKQSEDGNGNECKECGNDGKCKVCVDSDNYVPDSKGGCTRKCIDGKNNCKTCNKEATQCETCIEKENLIPTGYACLCKDSYEMIDGICVKAITPITIPPSEPKECTGCSTLSDDKKLQIIDPKDIDQNEIYKIDLDKGLTENKVQIKNPNKVKLVFIIPENTENVDINMEDENAPVTIECTGSTKLTLSKSNSVTIKSTGELTIKGSNVGAIIPTDELTITVDGDALTVNELHIYDEKTVKTDSKINIENVKIEQGGHFELTSTSAKVKKVEIGIEAGLEYTSAFGGSDILIYYGKKQREDYYPTVPISISEKIIQNPSQDVAPKTISIKNKEVNSLLEEKQLVVSYAQYKSKDDKQKANIKLIFDALKKAFNNGNSEIFDQLEFREEDFDSVKKTAKLIANYKSESKKNGLSGGAIAGIVVACVVVAAGIGVLVWYFAFYKKKVGISADESEP